MSWHEHLVVLPIVLPLVMGALMLLLDERRYTLKAALGFISIAILLATALALLQAADGQPVRVYPLGN